MTTLDEQKFMHDVIICATDSVIRISIDIETCSSEPPVDSCDDKISKKQLESPLQSEQYILSNDVNISTIRHLLSERHLYRTNILLLELNCTHD
jgi:hypothetical protein